MPGAAEVAADRHANFPPHVRAHFKHSESKRGSYIEPNAIPRTFLRFRRRGIRDFRLLIAGAGGSIGAAVARAFSADSAVGILARDRHARGAVWQ